jgi:hypothetical protein
LPPGFPAVPHYFNRVSVDPVLNQPECSDFTWRTKNLLWDELSVLKRKLNVKINNTISNQACLAKMIGRRVTRKKVSMEPPQSNGGLLSLQKRGFLATTFSGYRVEKAEGMILK